LVYLAVFSRFTESPVLHNSVLAVLLKKIIFPHKKILSLWILQDCGVREKKKKRINSKKQIEKKMINIIKTMCNPDATTGVTEH